MAIDKIRIQTSSAPSNNSNGEWAFFRISSTAHKNTTYPLTFNPDATVRYVAAVKAGDHFYLDTETDSKQVRINSRNFTQTSGNTIGFQSKPAQAAGSSGNVIGCEISPRVNDTFALTGSGTLIGAHVDAYLKGTTGNIAGDVRGMQVELVTDDAGTRTISGDVVGFRLRAAFSGTITGDMVAFRVEKAETQTNSKQWEYLFELTGDNGLVWRDTYTNQVATIAGAIKVRVNDQDRWIALYSGAPVV